MFGGTVLYLVKELTNNERRLRELGKSEYLALKMMYLSDNGLLIKLCDRLDNVSSLNVCPEKFALRYAGETRYILKDLDKRELNEAHKDVINSILETIKPWSKS